VRFIEFEFGFSELSAQATKKLDAFAKFLNEKFDLTLGIEGTADRQMDGAKLSEKQAEDQAIDDKQLNMLALTRANLVKNYLVRKGQVAAKRIQLKPAKITSSVDPGMVFLPIHFGESPTNVLTNADAFDPSAKIPEFKVSTVKIKKL